jgi:spermidine synthase
MCEKSSLKNRALFYILTALTISSGGCALAYEILYMRALSSVLGDMFYVNAALLSTFLAGIALGARYAHRVPRWLPGFEIGTGLFAFLMPAILTWLTGQNIIIKITSSPFFTAYATICLLAVPALFIGFSIPLYSAYMKKIQFPGLCFPHIYGAYNLGAIMSVLSVEFFMLRLFGVRASMMIIGGINIINGTVLLLLKTSVQSSTKAINLFFPPRTIYALILASLGSALFQMFFLKLTYHLFTPARENFALALIIVFSGLFLGTWCARRSKVRFESLLITCALTLVIIYNFFYPLLKLRAASLHMVNGSLSWIWFNKIAFECIFALLPMIMFGALIPTLMRNEKDVAAEAGYLLFVSGLANAAGYLLYVFAAYPFLSGGLFLGIVSLILLTASFVMTGFKWSRLQLIAASICIILIGVLQLTWRDRNFYTICCLDNIGPEDKVLTFKSNTDSATLIRFHYNYELVTYNGHSSIFVQKEGRVNHAEIVSGIIPALYTPRFNKALVIGLGTGITSGTLSTVFNHTDVVDMNGAFFKMLPHVAYANLNLMENKSAALHLADGRTFLVGQHNTYDAILNTAEAPDYFAAPKLYTLEFYQDVVKALKPDGVFCTWVSTPEMSEKGIELMLSALRKNFTYCDLAILDYSYCQFTCSNQPLHMKNFSDLHASIELKNQISNSLRGFTMDEYFQDIRISENLFHHYSPKVTRENTDDYPALEFLAVNEAQLTREEHDLFHQMPDLFNIDVVKKAQTPDLARLARRADVIEMISPWFFKKSFVPLLEHDRIFSTQFLLWKVSQLLSENKTSSRAEKLLEQVLVMNPQSAEAYNYLGTIYLLKGKNREASDTFKKALKLKPTFKEAQWKLEKAVYPATH